MRLVDVRRDLPGYGRVAVSMASAEVWVLTAFGIAGFEGFRVVADPIGGEVWVERRRSDQTNGRVWWWIDGDPVPEEVEGLIGAVGALCRDDLLECAREVCDLERMRADDFLEEAERSGDPVMVMVGVCGVASTEGRVSALAIEDPHLREHAVAATTIGRRPA